MNKYLLYGLVGAAVGYSLYYLNLTVIDRSLAGSPTNAALLGAGAGLVVHYLRLF